jgi:iron complex outermembrane recepter protein
MPINIRTPIAAALIAATPFPVLSVAQAQTLALEEVVVTAQRRETLLQETPIAVTAFSAEKIADLGIFDITDIGSFAPNTNIQKQPSSNSNMSIYIRGVGSGETSLMTDPKTSFYLDGVYMSKTVGSVFDIADLQSIEVLRGPQGTLFGRNSTGGAVNVTTVKPSGELGGKLEASVGSDGYYRLWAALWTCRKWLTCCL